MAEYASETRGASLRGSITSLLLPIPILCFVGALVTDLAYRGSGGNLLWLNFSSWLIATGLLFGGIAAVVLIVELMVYPLLRRTTGWWQLLLLAAAWVVEFVNALIHGPMLIGPRVFDRIGDRGFRPQEEAPLGAWRAG